MSIATEKAFDRDSLARFYADRHLSIDDAIVEIHYLRSNAPEREIRFLIVNRLVSESTTLDPVDYGVAIDGPDAHRLVVLDVTPNQWGRILDGSLALPEDWTLRNDLTIRQVSVDE